MRYAKEHHIVLMKSERKFAIQFDFTYKDCDAPTNIYCDRVRLLTSPDGRTTWVKGYVGDFRVCLREVKTSKICIFGTDNHNTEYGSMNKDGFDFEMRV